MSQLRRSVPQKRSSARTDHGTCLQCAGICEISPNVGVCTQHMPLWYGIIAFLTFAVLAGVPSLRERSKSDHNATTGRSYYHGDAWAIFIAAFAGLAWPFVLLQGLLVVITRAIVGIVRFVSR
jgi:hypothetical protein